MENIFGHTTQTPASSATLRVLAASYHKQTTGIVGLPIDEQARVHLKEKLEEVLTSLKAHGIPADAKYRMAIEETCTTKLKAIDSESHTDEQLEELFGRQLEQEIKLCKDELELIPKMAEWKPWEVPAGHTIDVVDEVEEGTAEQTAAGQK